MRQGRRVDAVTSSTAQIPPAQSLGGCCELQEGARQAWGLTVNLAGARGTSSGPEESNKGIVVDGRSEGHAKNRESDVGPKKLLTSNHIDGHLDHSSIDYIVPRDTPSKTPDHVGML
jgi:hypothetical protein